MEKVLQQCPADALNTPDTVLTLGNRSMVSVEIPPEGNIRIRNTEFGLSFVITPQGKVQDFKHLGRLITEPAEMSRYRPQIQGALS